MKKEETKFSDRVNKRLHGDVYKLRMDPPPENGVADFYYSGPGGPCWVEYKWCTGEGDLQTVELSALQRKWLMQQEDHKTTVLVIAGSPNGAYIHHGVPERRVETHRFTQTDEEVSMFLSWKVGVK